jgi:glycosyltransferase involved in cell wall biosynthesis
MKPTILAMTPAYLPGYKAGGSLRTLVNLVDRLCGEFDFRVVTLDRDFRETDPYPGVEQEQWTGVGNAQVYYMDPRRCTAGAIRALLEATPHELLYLNSCFHPGFTLNSLRLRRKERAAVPRVVVAPRGELGRGALSKRRLKKRAFLTVAKLAGLYRGVEWAASSESEAADIRREFGAGASVQIARDLMPANLELLLPEGGSGKRPGVLRVVTLSRISPEKGIKQAIGLLAALKGDVQLDIYGLIDDAAYWKECRALIERLPDNVKVVHRGALDYSDVLRVLGDHDLFFLPTLGENFGYAILEAMAAGCPVVISDRTPWRGLEEAGVGWDLPLEDAVAMAAALQRCVEMAGEEHAALSERARRYGLERLNDDDSVEQNRALLLAALGPQSAPVRLMSR